MSAIPEAAEHLDAEWLNAVLPERFATVHAVRTRDIGFGEGFVGQVYRLYLNEGEPDASTLIAKLASADPGTRELVGQIGGFDAEIRFYEELAPLAPIATPACYYTAMDHDTHACVLLLEDLPGRTVD